MITTAILAVCSDPGGIENTRSTNGLIARRRRWPGNRHREREQGRRLHIARSGVVARAVIRRNELGDALRTPRSSKPK